jgi:hypothetical protein
VPFAANVTGTGNVTITYKIGQSVITSPHTFPIGTTTVDVEAVTDCGTTSCSFTVTVNDDAAPVISNEIVSIQAFTGTSGGNPPCTAKIDAGATLPSGTDCSTFTTTIHAGAPVNQDFANEASLKAYAFPVGTTHVTYTFTDSHTNTSSTSLDVIVTDDTKPTIATSGDVTICAQSATSVAIGAPTVDDNCGVTPPVPVRSDNLPLSDPFPLGVTTITWTETDIHGNFSIATQTITLNLKPATPVIGAGGPITFCQPGSVTLTSSANSANQRSDK